MTVVKGVGTRGRESRRSVFAGESGTADQAVTSMYGTQYVPLVRLAVLLVGDLRAAEDMVQQSFADMHVAWTGLRDHDKAVSFLRRAVVLRARSRSAGPGGGPAAGGAAGGVADGGAESSAVITAVRALPLRQREALVLRLYLDLNDGQIACAMQISRAAVRGHAARGIAALQAVL
jgi:DNA-directed RNA polymerase specialized sigma24 family protein